ncbi:MAG: rRNA maturation RNase YbeY [Patescibacteria group bacterium]|jgi:probable rRNA maturation factor
MKLEINNTTKQRINKKLLQKAADVFGKKMGFAKSSISLAIVGEGKMKKINSACRGIDKPTDVLSFEFKDGENLGEIIICYEEVKKQAGRQGIPAQDELVFIFVHGLLHLIGFDDKKEKDREEMIKKGKKLCKSII